MANQIATVAKAHQRPAEELLTQLIDRGKVEPDATVKTLIDPALFDQLPAPDVKGVIPKLGKCLHLLTTGARKGQYCFSATGSDDKEFCSKHKSQHEAGKEPTAPNRATRRHQAYAKGTVGALVASYHNKGLNSLTSRQLEFTIRQVMGWSDYKVTNLKAKLPSGVERKLRPILDVFTAIEETWRDDSGKLKQWATPDPKELQKQGEHYTYEGICGHQTSISKKVYQERFENANDRVPAAFYLCDDCRAVRAALLDLVPGAADVDSKCSVCNEWTFRGQDHERREYSHAMSRGDIWDNLVGGVLHVYWLFKRLNPDHRYDDPRHVKLVKTREDFEQWRDAQMLEAGMLAMSDPEKAKTIKANAKATIEAREKELKLTHPDKSRPSSGRVRKSKSTSGRK